MQILSSLEAVVSQHCTGFDGAGSSQILEEEQRERISQSKERVTKAFYFTICFLFSPSLFILSFVTSLLICTFFLMPLPSLHRYTLKTVLQCSLVQDYSVLY